MSDSTGSRPRRTSAGQPPAWFKPSDPPLPPTRPQAPLQPHVPAHPQAPGQPQAWPPAAPAPGAGWAPGLPPHAQPGPHAQPSRPRTEPGQPGPADPPAPDHPKASPLARSKWLARVFATDEDETGGVDDWEAMLTVLDAPVAQHRVTVSSLRPRGGRTTTVLGLGTALALHRREPVTCVDVDPRGVLAQRLGPEHPRTSRDLIEALPSIHTSSDLRRYTSLARSRLEVLAAGRAAPLSATEYAAVLQVLLTFRPLVLTDTSSDLTAPAMREVFASTDSLVVPVPLVDDGIRSAVETLAWWESRAPQGARLARGAVLTLCRQEFPTEQAAQLRPRELRRAEDEFDARQDALEDEALRVFAPRVRAVVCVPHDPALQTPDTFWWDALEPETQDAFINVAHEVARGFAG